MRLAIAGLSAIATVLCYEAEKASITFKMATTQEEMSKLMANVTPWYKDPGRRKLYALLVIALLSAATNGYDGYDARPAIMHMD